MDGPSKLFTFMKEIHNIQEFVKSILEQQSEEPLIYRGHSSIGYDLKPSIGRNNYSIETEKEVFYEFKQKYHLYSRERMQNDMEVLFLAQHYGLPTRLLDWTYNPMVALYFACRSNFSKDGAIYCLTLKGMERADSNINPMLPQSFDEIIAYKKNMYIAPDYMDIRYANQKSLFLLCSQPQRKFTFTEPAFKICIDSKKQLLKELSMLGYDELLLFPQLDSLCNDIKRKFEL